MDASKVLEKPPTNVNGTCTGNRKYPDEQTLYTSGTIDDDILSVYSFPRFQTGFHFYQQAWEDCTIL